ncbi:hypothetical protein ABZ835_08090 [Streptomyces sp. NPDC047461]|uniref:hypothetical protein n=1 Tax=Streptomyces sp. NPDC047461 TaxID=3155619 RepID=UPI003410AECC
MLSFAFPVPGGPGQHEIDPASSPVLTHDRFRGRGVAAEKSAVFGEHQIEAAVADMECVLLTEHPALVFEDPVEFVPLGHALPRLWREDEVFQRRQEVDAVRCRRGRFDQSRECGALQKPVELLPFLLRE